MAIRFEFVESFFKFSFLISLIFISKVIINIIGPSIKESSSTFNGLLMFSEYRDIRIETIPIGIKTIVKALCCVAMRLCRGWDKRVTTLANSDPNL